MSKFMVSEGKLPQHGYTVWTLTGAEQAVRLLPDHGFNVYDWTYQGGVLLMEPVDITMIGTKYGIPLLFPTPNRMRDSQFTWRGKQYHQRKHGEDVWIHGLVKDEPWQVRCWADDQGAYAEGVITFAEGNPLYEAYPFPCKLTVLYTLHAGGLKIDARVDNTGSDDLPFGFAIHPYFSKRGDANQVFLTTPLTRIYENDEKLLPSGKILDITGQRWDTSDGLHSVQSLDLDNVYHGMNSDRVAVIEYPNSARITLRGDDSFRNLIVFTPKDRPGFCIEHQTCSTDALNLHAKGLLEEAGLLILPAGQTWRGWVTLDVEKI